MRPQSSNSKEPSEPSEPSELGGGAVPIEMPRFSTDEGTATLSAWLVAVGDRIEKGGLIAELETDKATIELEAPVEGRIESLLVAAGTEGLKPGRLLGRIVPAASVADPPPTASAPEPLLDESSRSSVTPLARRLAEAQGIDLERVTGTGVGGRIVQADIERSVSEPVQAARVREAGRVQDSAPVRAAAAKPAATRATVSGAPRPSAHLHLHCAMDAIVAARVRLNQDLASRGHSARITLNDFIVRAAALALRDVPAANLRRAGDRVEAALGIDVALLVATEAGPRTAVLRDADRKGLAVLSEEIRSRVASVRAGDAATFSTEGESGSSLAITSFARFGIESAYPMLPAEQVCLLGVGTVLEQPVVRSGTLAVGSSLSLTLAFDPSLLGGAVAAQLLSAVRGRLEDPLGMML